MLILLPPSEGKSAPVNPLPFEFSTLTYADGLTHLREQAIEAAGINAKGLTADPAISIYNGVLYRALDWKSLSKSQQKRGENSVRIISALFGVIAPSDKIFSYKSKIKNAHWGHSIGYLLAQRNDSLIIDCRSSTYRTIWSPPPEKTIEVRVFSVKSGERKVITHMSKLYRGELVRKLLSLKNEPKSIGELLEELSPALSFKYTKTDGPHPHYLDLLVDG